MKNQNERFDKYLEDLEFADDVSLITRRVNHTQKKTDNLRENAKEIGL